MSTGFKYVYNRLHEQSFLSSIALSCEGCTLVARQPGLYETEVCCEGVGGGGVDSPFREEALGSTRDERFTVMAACRSHCREAMSSAAVTSPVLFSSARAPSKISKSQSHNGTRGKEAARDRWVGLSAAKLTILGEVCEAFSRQTQKGGKSGLTAGGRGLGGGLSFDIRSLSLSLSLACTLHTLFNGPFLRQTHWTKRPSDKKKHAKKR